MALNLGQMMYGGELCDVAAIFDGKPVPAVRRSFRGEQVGDRGVLDGDPVDWDGREWVPANWRDVP